MNEIQVSVVLPVYNVAEFLKDCLDSLLVQTMKNIEIICVDDGSTDKSPEIIKEYQKKDPRIHLLQQKNQSAGIARNAGLFQAKGEYVVFLDSDDFFSSELLEKMHEKIQENDCDISICSTYYHNHITKINTPMDQFMEVHQFPTQDFFSGKDVPSLAFTPFAITTWNKMFKRTFLERMGLCFQGVFRMNEACFGICSFLKGERINITSKSLVYHRNGLKTNSTSTWDSYPKDWCTVLLEVKRQLDLLEITEELEISLKKYALSIAIKAIEYTKTFSGQETVYKLIQKEFEEVFEILKEEPHHFPSYQRRLYEEICLCKFEEYYFKKFVAKSKEAEQFKLNWLQETKETILFYGGGSDCIYLLHFFQEKNFKKPVAICDGNPKKIGTKINDIPIVSLNEALSSFQNPYFLITSKRYYLEIHQKLSSEVEASHIFTIDFRHDYQ